MFLYSTGMAAIWSGRRVLALGMSTAFMFCGLHTESGIQRPVQCLEKCGPSCHHFGHGLDSDIDDLEKLIEQESQYSSGSPVLMLSTEIPSKSPLGTSGNDFR